MMDDTFLRGGAGRSAPTAPTSPTAPPSPELPASPPPSPSTSTASYGAGYPLRYGRGPLPLPVPLSRNLRVGRYFPGPPTHFPSPRARPQYDYSASHTAMLYPIVMLVGVENSLPGRGPLGHLIDSDEMALDLNYNAPNPLPAYNLAQCSGLSYGPTLLAFHTYMMHRRFPCRRGPAGENLLDKSHAYLFAERPELGGDQDMIIGIESEKLSRLAVAALVTNNLLGHLVGFCDELSRTIEMADKDPNFSLSFTDLRTGYHGALSMLRMLRQWTVGAPLITESLAMSLVRVIVEEHLGYSRDWCAGLTSEIKWRLGTVEDDIGLLTEMALMWPEASTAPADTLKYKLADIIMNELKVILVFQRHDGSWPTLVGKSNIKMETTALLERGRWYTAACLQHLHAYMGAGLSRRHHMKPLIEKALDRLESEGRPQEGARASD